MPDSTVWVIEGEVIGYVTLPKYIVQTLGPGQEFGDLGLADASLPLTYMASKKTSALNIKRSVLKALLVRYPVDWSLMNKRLTEIYNELMVTIKRMSHLIQSENVLDDDQSVIISKNQGTMQPAVRNYRSGQLATGMLLDEAYDVLLQSTHYFNSRRNEKVSTGQIEKSPTREKELLHPGIASGEQPLKRGSDPDPIFVQRCVK